MFADYEVDFIDYLNNLALQGAKFDADKYYVPIEIDTPRLWFEKRVALYFVEAEWNSLVESVGQWIFTMWDLHWNKSEERCLIYF